MSVYLDASVLVSLLADDAFSQRADSYFRGSAQVLLISDFAAAEFASVVARQMRMGNIVEKVARSLFSDFDVLCAGSAERLETLPGDVRAAEAILRRLDLPLRAPDALHIAIAQRIGAELATFDEKMAVGARILAVPLAAI